MSIRALQVFTAGALIAAGSVAIASPTYNDDDSWRSTSDPHVMMSHDGRLSTQVQYENTDLNSNDGAHTVYRRLQSAAETVCGDNGSFVHDLSIRRNMDQCENSAIEDAVNRINSPKLTAVYDQNAPEDVRG
jgi:UrcA family protein